MPLRTSERVATQETAAPGQAAQGCTVKGRQPLVVPLVHIGPSLQAKGDTDVRTTTNVNVAPRARHSTTHPQRGLAASKARTAGSRPPIAATCSGVEPRRFGRLVSALCASSSSTDAVWLLWRVAQCRGTAPACGWEETVLQPFHAVDQTQRVASVSSSVSRTPTFAPRTAISRFAFPPRAFSLPACTLSACLPL